MFKIIIKNFIHKNGKNKKYEYVDNRDHINDNYTVEWVC